MQTLPQEYDLGYIFYPPENPNDPGHPRLDIRMQDKPTYQHFDPEHVLVNVFSTTDGLETLKLQHPWTGSDHFRVFPGRVTMQDRLNKTVAAFTFGGELAIETQEDKTTCILTSDAPILGLAFDHTISMLLTEEAEIFMAELRAGWAHDPEALEKRLAETEPLEFYALFLKTLREKFKTHPKLEDPLTHGFLHYLNVTSYQIHEGKITIPNPQALAGLTVPI